MWSGAQQEAIDTLNHKDVSLVCLPPWAGKSKALCGLVATLLNECDSGTYNILVLSSCRRLAVRKLEMMREMCERKIIVYNSEVLQTEHVSIMCVPWYEKHFRAVTCDLLLVDEWEVISEDARQRLEPLIECCKVLLMSRTLEEGRHEAIP